MSTSNKYITTTNNPKHFESRSANKQKKKTNQCNKYNISSLESGRYRNPCELRMHGFRELWPAPWSHDDSEQNTQGVGGFPHPQWINVTTSVIHYKLSYRDQSLILSFHFESNVEFPYVMLYPPECTSLNRLLNQL